MDEILAIPRGAVKQFQRLGGREFFDRQLDEGLSHIGGYTFEGLDHMITQTYGQKMAWDVWSMPVPKKRENLPLIKALLDCSVWANVRANKIHMVFIPGTTNWGELFVGFGAAVNNVPKVSKRIAGMMARRALSYWTSKLLIHEVPQDAYATKDFGDNTEKLLDGTGIISRRLFDTMQYQWYERVRNDYPQFRIDAMAARFERAIFVNFRGYTHRGLLKGNFMVREVEDIIAQFGADYDIIVPEGSWKEGVTMPVGENFVTAEVQEYHDSVWTDPQTQINLRAAHLDAFMTQITKDFLAKEAKKISSGELLGHVGDLLNYQVDSLSKEGIDEEEFRDLTIRWNAAEWVARGLDLRNSESLLRGVAEAKSRVILQEAQPKRPARYKIPIPCAWYMQVISQSAAKLLGYDGKVKDGVARVWWYAKVIVISDEDWVNHYERFGGHDLDDFFKVFFRTIKGVKSLLIVRSPNELGGYGVFRFHEGDKCPTWRHDGVKEQFPVIKGRLPKFIDDAFKDGDTVLYELDNDVEDIYSGVMVTREDVMRRIESASARKVSAGMLVNAVMFWALVMKTPVPVGFGTLETYIDLTTQDDLSGKAAVSLQFLATLLVATAINSGKPIDRKFFEDREIGNMVTKLTKAGIINPPNLVDSGPDAFFSVRFRHISEEVQKFLDFARNIANEATPPAGLEELGALKVGGYGDAFGKSGWDGAGILRRFRKLMSMEWETARARTKKDEDPKLTDAQWKKLYNGLHKLVTTNKLGRDLNIVGVHNQILGLALSTYKYRSGYLYCQMENCRDKAGAPLAIKGVKYQVCNTHRRQLKLHPELSKKLEKASFSDQPVTNPKLFPLYMEAMEFYGLAQRLGTQDDKLQGVNVTCRECGRHHTYRGAVIPEKDVFKDMVAFQEFLVADQVCRRHRK